MKAVSRGAGCIWLPTEERRVIPAAAFPLGVAIGLLALAAGDIELRWIIYFGLALTAAVVLLVARNTERLLTIIFVLSLQADVNFRLMYRHVGSDGFAFPLAVVAGIALLTYQLARRRMAASVPPFTWDGRFRWLVVFWLATSVVSVATSTERFVGLTQLFFEVELVFIYWLT